MPISKNNIMLNPYPLLIAIIFLAVTHPLCAQTPNWKWAKEASGNESDIPQAIATDVNGNVIVAGYFASDSLVVGNTVLQNSAIGFQEAFIAKYDSSGNLQWAYAYGGTMDDKATAVGTDAQGNVYLAGYFYSPTITFGATTLTNAGNVGDIFLVKYSSTGNIIWVKREGAAALEIPYAMHVETTGEIILAGRFSSNSVTFGTTTLTLAGSMDVFVVRYDAAGNVDWAIGDGGGSNDEAYAVTTDGGGNVIVAGYFGQTAVFGTTTLIADGLSDIFVAKYTMGGNFLWAVRAGGDGDDRANGVAADASGNIYITGFFINDTVSFGNIVIPNAPDDNAFVAGYDAGGGIRWAHGISGDCRAYGIAAMPNGEVYACGSFNDAPLLFNGSSLANNGDYDFFILHYDNNGNNAWAVHQSSGGADDGHGQAIAKDNFGALAICGYYERGPVSFGPSVLNTINSNGTDVFVARMGGVTTAINHIENENDISLYPNPSNGKFILKTNSVISAIEIYNAVGEKVFAMMDLKQRVSTEINISSFPEGIYFLKVFDGEKYVAQKMIVH
ncbi:MAG TPA: T9SS type A sorting domain-containing protein [Bacteroidia bacterium]|nr:T9SS type A sorting domain-containing protein [Bacteroidia bacterium]HNU32904.1 T9SS type A sorting domain-containing protein [Bacteroidia bacterium]